LNFEICPLITHPNFNLTLKNFTSNLTDFNLNFQDPTEQFFKWLKKPLKKCLL